MVEAGGDGGGQQGRGGLAVDILEPAIAPRSDCEPLQACHYWHVLLQKGSPEGLRVEVKVGMQGLILEVEWAQLRAWRGEARKSAKPGSASQCHSVLVTGRRPLSPNGLRRKYMNSLRNPEH